MRLINFLVYLAVLAISVGLGLPALSKSEPTVADRLLLLSIPVVLLAGVAYLAFAGASWLARRWRSR